MLITSPFLLEHIAPSTSKHHAPSLDIFTGYSINMRYFFGFCNTPWINVINYSGKYFYYYFYYFIIFDIKVKNKTFLFNKICWRGNKRGYSCWRVFANLQEEKKSGRSHWLRTRDTGGIISKNQVSTPNWVLKRRRLINDEILGKIL